MQIRKDNDLHNSDCNDSINLIPLLINIKVAAARFENLDAAYRSGNAQISDKQFIN